MHFEDLAPFGLLAEFAPGTRVRAVGWLQRESPYRLGTLDSRVMRRLFDFVETEWSGPRAHMLGYHACDLCPNAQQRAGTLVVWRQPRLLGTWKTRKAVVGGSELYVPGQDCVYVAPSMILHFVLAHGYGPPPEFSEAVLASPDLGTPEYLLAVRANGGEQYV